MKQRRGRRLILETIATESNRDGPTVAGEFPNAALAFLFQHFEQPICTDVPFIRKRIMEGTNWRGFTSWHDAVSWLNA